MKNPVPWVDADKNWSLRRWVAVAGTWTVGHVVIAAVVGVSVPDPTERGLAISVVVAVAILGLLIMLERNVQHHEAIKESVGRKLRGLGREPTQRSKDLEAEVVAEVTERTSLRRSSVVWIASFVFVAVIVAIVMSQTMPTAASRGLSAASVSLFAIDAALAYYAWRKHHRAGDERLTHDYKYLQASMQIQQSRTDVKKKP